MARTPIEYPKAHITLIEWGAKIVVGDVELPADQVMGFTITADANGTPVLEVRFYAQTTIEDATT